MGEKFVTVPASLLENIIKLDDAASSARTDAPGPNVLVAEDGVKVGGVIADCVFALLDAIKLVADQARAIHDL